MRKIIYILLPVLAIMIAGVQVTTKAADALQVVNRSVFYAAEGREVLGIAVAETYTEKERPDYADYTVIPDFCTTETDGKLIIKVKGRMAFAGAVGHWQSGRLGKLITAAAAEANGDETVFTITQAAGSRYEVIPVKRRYTFTNDNKLLLQTFVAVRVYSRNSPDKLVAIDPGHGGPEDLGTCANNIYEKYANLDIARLLREQLLDRKIGVYMTRTEDCDLGLGERGESANLLGADVFVSVHNNAFDPASLDVKAAKMYKGTTVLYNSKARQPAKDLAIAMNDQLVEALHTHEYPVQDRPGLSVLNSTWMPAVLAECTMFPNNGDAKLITDRVNRQKAAEAIANAVARYLDGGRLQQFLPEGTKAAATVVQGNEANHNLAVCDGDWIYYVEAAGDTYGGSDSRIYRVHPDGSGQVKGETFIIPFCEDSASGLCLYGDYLYYENWSDGQKIYKISTDGKCKKKISDGPARWLQRSGIWLVYAKSEVVTGNQKDNGLYKKSLITGEETKLADGGVENVCTSGGYAYYQNSNDGYRIWRVALNEGKPERTGSVATIFFVVVRNKIYYVNNEDFDRLYVCNADGSNPIRLLAERNIGYILLLNDRIYYTRTDIAGLWCTDTDGKNNRKITGIAGGPINAAGGLLYYRSMFLNENGVLSESAAQP